jgi:hypothetical protein
MLKKTKNKIAACLISLSQITQDFFACCLAGDYAERHYFYERQFHLRRKKFLSAIQQLRQMQEMKESPLVTHFENGYEIVLSLGLILYRIKDHSTFSVASKELLAVSNNITGMFQYLMSVLWKKKLATVVESLAESIQQLEAVNQSTLQVIASDPLAVVLFIYDLRALDDVLMHLNAGLAK